MVKVISLSNEAYSRLKNIKNDKSFSEIIIEITNERGNSKDSINNFFGGLNNLDWKEKEKGINKFRKSFSKRLKK